MEISIEPALILNGVLRGFFYVTLLIVLWTCLGSQIKKAINKLWGSKNTSIKKDVATDYYTEKQRLSRSKLQEKFYEKTQEYEGKYFIPREDAKKAQKQKEYYKFVGPVPFDGHGQRLGDEEQGIDDSSTNLSLRHRTIRGSQDAARARKLPDNITKPVSQPQQMQKKEKRVVIELPDEPPEGTPNTVTVAMRSLRGKIKKRRFLTSNKVQVLIDWMQKQGYHSKLYTVCTPYPRRDLSLVAEQTLEEAGLVRDVMVVIEEREHVLDEEKD